MSNPEQFDAGAFFTDETQGQPEQQPPIETDNNVFEDEPPQSLEPEVLGSVDDDTGNEPAAVDDSDYLTIGDLRKAGIKLNISDEDMLEDDDFVPVEDLAGAFKDSPKNPVHGFDKDDYMTIKQFQKMRAFEQSDDRSYEGFLEALGGAKGDPIPDRPANMTDDETFKAVFG